MNKLEAMKAYVQVVQAGGFAAAAREMEMTRSAVNKLVAQLEDHLGVQLLHRTTRQVSPTEAGEAYYQRCLGILADIDEAEAAMSHLQANPTGSLRVNAPMSFGTLHLGPAIIDFMTQYPDIQVQLTLNDRFVDPIEEGFDLTVRIAQPDPSSPYITHTLTPAHRVLCASPSYLVTYGTPMHPADLKHHRCLHYGYLASGNQWKLMGSDGEHSIKVKGILCSNNAEILRDAAVRGLGIALLPTFMAGAHLRQGQLQHVLPNYQAPDIMIMAIYPPNRYLSAKVQLLTDYLKHTFQDPGWDAFKHD